MHRQRLQIAADLFGVAARRQLGQHFFALRQRQGFTHRRQRLFGPQIGADQHAFNIHRLGVQPGRHLTGLVAAAQGKGPYRIAGCLERRLSVTHNQTCILHRCC
ncbi:hypothetical protein AK51_24865 [Serratia nematodiphila DZ0503SBS1]|nr:hypothetical protein AK51_24865 [Serratia nematodiphila DZ0503SBS1]